MPKIKGRGNNGRKILVMIIVVAVAIGLFQLGKMSVKNNKEIALDTNKNSDMKTDYSIDVKVTANEGKISDNKKPFVINVKYPILTGIPDKTIQEKININIKKNIVDSIESFKTGILADQSPVDFGSPTMDGGYQFFGNYKGIVSVEEKLSEYSPGAAHPNNYSNTYSFYLNNGEVINSVTDLCIDKNNCLPSIAKLTQKYLKSVMAKMQVNAEDWTADGSSAKLENYQDFMALTDGLKIIFDPYQVAPYSAGTIYVTVPWNELSGIIKSGFIK